jgi:hypothetical protein
MLIYLIDSLVLLNIHISDFDQDLMLECWNAEEHWNSVNMATPDKRAREKQHAKLPSPDGLPSQCPPIVPSSHATWHPSLPISPFPATPACKKNVLLFLSLSECYSDGQGSLSGLSFQTKACCLWRSQILPLRVSAFPFLKWLSSFPSFFFLPNTILSSKLGRTQLKRLHLFPSCAHVNFHPPSFQFTHHLSSSQEPSDRLPQLKPEKVMTNISYMLVKALKPKEEEKGEETVVRSCSYWLSELLKTGEMGFYKNWSPEQLEDCLAGWAPRVLSLCRAY